MNLKQLQNDFLACISSDNENNLINSDFQTQLCNEGSINPKQRILIYKNAYRSRLCSVIDDDFPFLGKLIGDELYHPLCQAYISAHPSREPSINYFCSQLPNFIQNYAPLKNHKIVVELCNLEWQLRTTFDAKNSEALPNNYLQNIPNEQWPSLTFKLIPSFTLHHFTMNTVAVWQALKDNISPEITSLEQPQTWMIWRQGLITQYRSIEVDEACLLIAIKEGHSFEFLCEALLEWWPEERVPERATQLLQNWLNLGLFTL